jgi:hypothetical protein
MINRNLPDTGYWDATPREIAGSDAQLLFGDCFGCKVYVVEP